MDLSLTEEQQFIQSTASDFATSTIANSPRGENGDLTHESFLANLKQLAELGFMGMNVSEQYSGSEIGTIGFSLAITELARQCASTAVTVSVTNMVAEVIQAIGTEAQKQRYLPPICDGSFSAAGFCLSEAGAGSDPASMKTKARRDGDHWVLNGTKMWITSAPYAGVFVVWAVTDPNQPRGKGISCFLVDANTPGIEIGPPEKKLGQHASKTCPVIFENCRIPADALLGQENQGYKIAVTELAGGRIGIASLALGVGQEAMDYARAYLCEREQFQQPLSQFQGLQWSLADAYTELEAARLLIMQAASLKESGKPFIKEASMAKLFASESANKACYTALQMAGGIGYTQDCPLERYTRDVRITAIYEGTSEIQRIVIARELLREIT